MPETHTRTAASIHWQFSSSPQLWVVAIQSSWTTRSYMGAQGMA